MKVMDPQYGETVDRKMEIFNKLISGSKIAGELTRDYAKMLRHSSRELVNGRKIGRDGF